ncbi:MAG TPA: lipid-binding SYLF domain-containing protein [Burkholderiales bacterium]|jgi:lipid-binding SYLF domain-containing protein
MCARLFKCSFTLFILLVLTPAFADEYADAIKVFRNAGESGKFFKNSYGYAVFPTIGKGAFVIGAAHGSGRAYVGGKYVGDTSMTQVTVGAQVGGQAYREIIFFQNKATFDAFKSGNFEFGAQASAVAITAGASAQAGTSGTAASASATENKAATGKGGYQKGVAVFTVTEGGLMYEASIGGQKFSYEPRKK